jgi:hypothetical protein
MHALELPPSLKLREDPRGDVDEAVARRLEAQGVLLRHMLHDPRVDGALASLQCSNPRRYRRREPPLRRFRGGAEIRGGTLNVVLEQAASAVQEAAQRRGRTVGRTPSRTKEREHLAPGHEPQWCLRERRVRVAGDFMKVGAHAQARVRVPPGT